MGTIRIHELLIVAIVQMREHLKAAPVLVIGIGGAANELIRSMSNVTEHWLRRLSDEYVRADLKESTAELVKR